MSEASIHQSLQLAWPSLRQVREVMQAAALPHGPSHGMARSEFVLDVEIIARDRAMIEAWVETAHGRRSVLPRQLAGISCMLAGSMLHVDAFADGDERAILAAISVMIDDHDDFGGRILYARTPLLAKAGFHPGSCDRPSLKRLESRRHVASA